MKACLVYITTASLEEAKKISYLLIEKNLVACANIINGVTSIFEWEGKIQEQGEYLLLVKSRIELFEILKKVVLKNHSYHCPCITMLPILKGHKEFLDWISQKTTKNKIQTKVHSISKTKKGKKII